MAAGATDAAVGTKASAYTAVATAGTAHTTSGRAGAPPAAEAVPGYAHEPRASVRA